MSKLSKLFLLCILLLLAIGQAHAFPGKKASSDAGAAAPAAAGNSGTVVQTMSSGGYTYVLLDRDGNESWAAMPETEVKVGEEVTLAPGAPMNNFNSRTLNRTFDTIYFTPGVVAR
jgi:membrane protein implicated in regulation of membrane protease activity